jgi:hypothetical protein
LGSMRASPIAALGFSRKTEAGDVVLVRKALR